MNSQQRQGEITMDSRLQLDLNLKIQVQTQTHCITLALARLLLLLRLHLHLLHRLLLHSTPVVSPITSPVTAAPVALRNLLLIFLLVGSTWLSLASRPLLLLLLRGLYLLKLELVPRGSRIPGTDILVQVLLP